MHTKSALSLIPVSQGVYVISPSKTAANVGVICVNEKRADAGVFLVDCGGNSKDAEAVYAALCSGFGSNFSIRAVINTHSHADHSGGSSWFARNTGCGIWMTQGERGGLENNMVQAAVTCGCEPLPEITTPYYVQEKCTVTRVIAENDCVELEGGRKITFVSLPGHYFDMIGVAVLNKDGKNTFFISDALFGAKMISRFEIPFILDISSFLETLDKIAAFPAAIFVPGHGDILKSAVETIEMNKISILKTITSIHHCLGNRKMTADELIKAVSDEECIKMGVQQYFLIGSTVRSFLSYLYKAHRIKCEMNENRLLWSLV